MPLPPLGAIIEECLEDVTEHELKSAFYDLTDIIEEDEDRDWTEVTFIEEDEPIVTIVKRYIKSKKEVLNRRTVLKEIRQERIKFDFFL